MMTHGEVLAVKAKEEIGEYEDDENGGAKENQDEEKVWFFRVDLFDFHLD